MQGQDEQIHGERMLRASDLPADEAGRAAQRLGDAVLETLASLLAQEGEPAPGGRSAPAGVGASASTQPLRDAHASSSPGVLPGAPQSAALHEPAPGPGVRACADLACLMARCSSPTFYGLQTELLQSCPDLVPDRFRRDARANLPKGSWKAFVLQGLTGTRSWSAAGLRRVVAVMRDDDAPVCKAGLDRARLDCELGLLIRVRVTCVFA
jgi:hypothetical protein